MQRSVAAWGTFLPKKGGTAAGVALAALCPAARERSSAATGQCATWGRAQSRERGSGALLLFCDLRHRIQLIHRSKDQPPVHASSHGAVKKPLPRAASNEFGDCNSGVKWVSALLRERREGRLSQSCLVSLVSCHPMVSAVGFSLNLLKPLVKSSQFP